MFIFIFYINICFTMKTFILNIIQPKSNYFSGSAYL